MKLIKKEWLFFIFLSLFVILVFQFKPTFNELYSFIDWGTIRALTALLLITTAMKLSKIFDFIALKTLNKFKNERILAFAFITASVLLSMFLTNDITLFIMVPLTLAFSSQIKNDLTKLIIFEAIAVNVGSMLTPFGNPQNIFLFRQMDTSVLTFIEKMGVVFIPSIIVLFIFVLIFFPKKQLIIHVSSNMRPDKKLFFISLGLFVLFIISLELSFVRFVLIAILGVYAFIKKEVFKQFDYFLIFTFIIMFMDFGLVSRIESVKTLMHSFPHTFFNIFNVSVLTSQIISNVPAAIFMSNFSHNYTAIAYGVNIAGNGLLIGSLANIIALRFLHNPKVYFTFHKYSLPYFFLSYLLVLLIVL
jgi:Na+/H+ antiporter NhaD/arsenite permease-like protein